MRLLERLLGAPRSITSEICELHLGERSFYDLAEHFVASPHFALLDSRGDYGDLGRYCFLAFQPFLIVGSRGSGSWVEHDGIRYRSEADVLSVLDCVLAHYRMPGRSAVCRAPFLGGAIGYFAYEFGRQLERLPATALDELALPDCYFCFYNFVIVLAREQNKIFLCYCDVGPATAVSRTRLEEQLAAVTPGSYREPHPIPDWNQMRGAFTADFSRDAYLHAINGVKEYILAGDIYQANLTQRFTVEVPGCNPWSLYKRLASINPAPFASYLNLDDVTVVSSSPERFLLVEDRAVETRPIKGTIARGATPQQDGENREWLYHSGKNRAELAMIVDLMRNDVGRVCRPGTVKVATFPELVTYPSVHHLVGTITGELRPERTAMDLVRACFPGGSITGAPKIRAMEIIDEFEPLTRGIYTGSIGYLGFNSCCDLNIAIRTIVVKAGKAYVHAGGGIVADSVDVEEYEESLLKAERLLRAIAAERAGAMPPAEPAEPVVRGVAV